MTIDEKIIKAYALKNAVEHNGKAQIGSVIPGLFNHGLTKDKIRDISPKVNEIVKQVNSLSIENQNQEFEKYKDIIGHRPERQGLPELDEVKQSGVIMRFAPAPSGPLHIGHIISSTASSLYVKKYGGKFYIRIEDTDPERIDPDAYDSIKTDFDWLFGNVSEYIIQSSRLETYYKYALELLSKGKAYVCTCSSEKFKKLVDLKKPCPCRGLDLKENILRWNKMLDKTGYKEGEAVLRFKSDLDNPNPAMRDFPLARINTKPHPLVKNKYKVWPLMNLSVTVDDIEYKMTHVIRGKDHKDNAERQKMIYQALGKDKDFPKTYFIGRIKFKDVVLSKRKIKEAIKEGEYESENDIRLPTIATLRNRGYQPEAFYNLAIERGISEVDKVMTITDFFTVLDNFNREILREKTKKADFKETSKKDSNIIILMPDNKEIFAKTNITASDNEILYFEKFGYAKLNGTKDNKQYFWFTHS